MTSRAWTLLLAASLAGALSGCKNGGSECGVCADMASKCSWSAGTQGTCQGSCQARVEHPSRCDASYEAARSCFANPASWTCGGLVGCGAEIGTYDDCRMPPWQPITDLPKSVRSLAQDPRSPRTVYAATGSGGSGGGLYQSTDGGATWSRLPSSFPGAGNYIDVTAVTVTGQGLLLAAVQRSIFKSTDEGKSWTQVSTAPVSEVRDVDVLRAASPDGQLLYAVVDEDGFLRSEDGGKTWKASNQGLPVETYGPGLTIVYTQALALDPNNLSTVYLGTGRSHIANGANGVFKSTDRGLTWSPANKGILEFRATSLIALSSSHLIVGTDDMATGPGSSLIYESTDGAQTWTSIYTSPSSSPAAVLQLAARGSTVFALTESLDLQVRSGDAWQTIARAPATSGAPLMFVDKGSLVVIDEPKPIFVAGTTSGAFRHVEE